VLQVSRERDRWRGSHPGLHLIDSWNITWDGFLPVERPSHRLQSVFSDPGGAQIDELRNTIRQSPSVVRRGSGLVLDRGCNDHAEATFRELERLRPESAYVEMYRGILAARRGDSDEARRSLARLEERAKAGELTVFFAGFVHFALGEMDAFVECMERAFELHALPLMDLMYSPMYESARNDPRIVDLLRRQREVRPPLAG
jgi:predicted Zn-dependent protease